MLSFYAKYKYIEAYFAVLKREVNTMGKDAKLAILKFAVIYFFT